MNSVMSHDEITYSPVIPGPVTARPPLHARNACRSVSDDDLYTWRAHLLYRPGEFSLCQLSQADGLWPSHCDEKAIRSSARHAD